MKIRSLTHWLATRARKQPVTTVVLHATAGGSASGAITWLQKIGLSYHYVIDKDGTITKCAPYSRVAFHAGVSRGPSGSGCNGYSIGIAFVNLDNGKDPITQQQLDSCKALLAELFHDIVALKYITRHRDVSPGRKVDPNTLSYSQMMAIKPANAIIWKPD